MTDINEITNGLITMDHDYYDRLDGDERVKVLESIMLWAKWEMNNQQRWNEQADALFNRELGITNKQGNSDNIHDTNHRANGEWRSKV